MIIYASKKHPAIGNVADADLRLLRVFRSVADCGGMAAAELDLNIAVSTISRHVKDLEERVGMVLCRRGRAGFALTPEGERVYAAADRLLLATDAFKVDLNDIRRNMGGELHIALFEQTTINPRARVADAIREFHRRAPGVSLKLYGGTIASIEQGVLDGRFQLGLIPEHRRSKSLGYSQLFPETMLLYAAKGHPWFDDAARKRTWSELRAQRLAGLDYHSPNMELTADDAPFAERLATAYSALHAEPPPAHHLSTCASRAKRNQKYVLPCVDSLCVGLGRSYPLA